MASLGDVADPMTEIEIDFHIADHPHLGYRKEDRIDWERAYVTDIQQGAFMGDAILRLGGVDFSTVDGWRGLVEWCLRLDSSVRWLESGSPSHVMSEPDSDDHVRVNREGQDLVVSSTRVDGTAVVDAQAFGREAGRFLRRSIEWIDAQYPGARLNPSASDIWARLDRYR